MEWKASKKTCETADEIQLTKPIFDIWPRAKPACRQVVDDLLDVKMASRVGSSPSPTPPQGPFAKVYPLRADNGKISWDVYGATQKNDYSDSGMQ